MDRIKVLVISSVAPNARGSGGELVLHRCLKSNPRDRPNCIVAAISVPSESYRQAEGTWFPVALSIHGMSLSCFAFEQNGG